MVQSKHNSYFQLAFEEAVRNGKIPVSLTDKEQHVIEDIYEDFDATSMRGGVNWSGSIEKMKNTFVTTLEDYEKSFIEKHSKYNNRKGTSISVCAMGKRIESYYLFDSRIEQAKEVLENIKDYFKNDIEEIQEWEFDSYEYSDQDFESEIAYDFFHCSSEDNFESFSLIKI